MQFCTYVSETLQEMEKILLTMLCSFAKSMARWVAFLADVVGCSLQMLFFPFCCNIKSISLGFWVNRGFVCSCNQVAKPIAAYSAVKRENQTVFEL